MGNTTSNIPLPSNTWINISEESKIPYGQNVVIENIGINILRMCVSPLQPANDTDKFQNFYPGGFPIIAKISDYPIWAYSANTDGAINVRPQSQGLNPVIETMVTEAPSDIRVKELFRINVVNILCNINEQLILLNARFESTFESEIDIEDIQDECD